MRCWAPNGYDVMEWPSGEGLVPFQLRDYTEESLQKMSEGGRKGAATRKARKETSAT